MLLYFSVYQKVNEKFKKLLKSTRTYGNLFFGEFLKHGNALFILTDTAE